MISIILENFFLLKCHSCKESFNQVIVVNMRSICFFKHKRGTAPKITVLRKGMNLFLLGLCHHQAKYLDTGIVWWLMEKRMGEWSLGENYTSITTFHALAVTERKFLYSHCHLWQGSNTSKQWKEKKNKKQTLTPNKWSNLQEYLYEIALDGEISDETDNCYSYYAWWSFSIKFGCLKIG